MVNVNVKAETKVFWKSKTFWINTAFLIGALVTALAGEYQAAGTLTTVSVANIILRLMTKEGVALKQ